MLAGAHESVAGGLYRAFDRGAADGCKAVQVFTKNSNMWREPTLTDEQITAFRRAHRAFGGGGSAGQVMSHTSYLINLATDKDDILSKSKDALVAEVQRCSALGIPYCILHPGAHLGAGDEVGLLKVAQALDEVHDRTKDASCMILLENTAGQGTCVGCTFEQIGAIFAQSRDRDRFGVCFDTQHAFAAGYDLSTAEGYASTFEAFDRHVGLHRLRAFHLNDSKKPLGSRVDRHEHLGEGILGLGLFWRLMNDPRFDAIPGVVETEPREGDFPFRDEVSLLAGLVGAPEPPRPAPEAVPFALELTPPAAKRGRR